MADICYSAPPNLPDNNFLPAAYVPCDESVLDESSDDEKPDDETLAVIALEKYTTSANLPDPDVSDKAR